MYSDGKLEQGSRHARHAALSLVHSARPPCSTGTSELSYVYIAFRSSPYTCKGLVCVQVYVYVGGRGVVLLRVGAAPVRPAGAQL